MNFFSAGRDMQRRPSWPVWLCLSLWAGTVASAGPPDVSCGGEGNAGLAVGRIDCVTEEQLQILLAYEPPLVEDVMRQALATASEVSACVNDHRLFPEDPQERKDYQCLQRRLLDFYNLAGGPDRPAELHVEDLLSRAASRIHYCMLDESLPISRCLTLFQESLHDYRLAFQSARQVHADPENPESLELAEAMGIRLEMPAPPFRELERFVELALENSRRFPHLLGKPIGEALGPVLCDAFQLYPERRSYVAGLYNLLIRFDSGNLASSRRLYEFMQKLGDFFRSAPGLPSHLQLRPADWSGGPAPCGEEDWHLLIPKFELLPGFRPPTPERIESGLGGLQSILLETAELAEVRNHVWKPFHRYGRLLFVWAQSLKRSAARTPNAWRARHAVMEKARDALLMRGVEPSKLPFDPSQLRDAAAEAIQSYTRELLNDLRLIPLIEFAEASLEGGEPLLTEAQLTALHRLLAVAYFLQGDDPNALVHLEQCDLRLADLERIRQRLQEQTGLFAPR